MNKLILIAAIGENNELGIDNHLIWYLKEDLNFFKEQTMNHPIVMGYNTFVSLPKLLPGRKNIILTHKNLDFKEEVIVYNDKDELLDYLKKLNSDIYIIGGASIYKQFIDDADQLVLTEIADSKEADTFFPEIVKEDWDKELIDKKEENGVAYKHVRYNRRK